MAEESRRFVTARGLTEDGVVTGNVFDKYGSRNPLVRHLMKGFHDGLEKLVSRTGARSIHEVGCGEGYWTIRWAGRGIQTRGTDFSSQVIDVARQNAARQAAAVPFRTASVYDLAAPGDSAELVVCCEVLEHLDDPARALRVLTQLADPWLLISVPREPIWSFMNMARGKYWSNLGNTPGHIQRWSTSAITALLRLHVDVVAVETPLPWTIALCRRRG